MRIKHDNTNLLTFASSTTHIGVFAKEVCHVTDTYLVHWRAIDSVLPKYLLIKMQKTHE